MRKKGKLLPCPFCGCTEIYDHYKEVYCSKCGVMLPRRLWNKRVGEKLDNIQGNNGIELCESCKYCVEDFDYENFQYCEHCYVTGYKPK